jgi:hypothetical protein
MDKIEVSLELCTVYRGIPYGQAIIKYSHPDNIHLSFKGIGVFNQGKLSNSSFICIKDSGVGVSYTKMENEKPAVNSYATFFYPKGYRKRVDSLYKKIVSGW